LSNVSRILGDAFGVATHNLRPSPKRVWFQGVVILFHKGYVLLYWKLVVYEECYFLVKDVRVYCVLYVVKTAELV
jgi:hypothetical protein